MYKSQKEQKDDLKISYFLKSYSIKDILYSDDFLLATSCSVIVLLLIVKISTDIVTLENREFFLLKTSEVILSNSIVINSSLLGIIVASIAIFASFSRPEILMKMYEHKKDESRLHQYILVLFYPAIPAIIGIFTSYIGQILLISKCTYTIYGSCISMFFTFYCIFGVWESIKQIAKSVISQARANITN
ncbi:hypothetical protein [Methanomethylovorans sp.]|uniref:hypothetical protein n=1 Tax=Methanomethylovorans sp. TaxID=2758717 RepID=UPI002FDEA26E